MMASSTEAVEVKDVVIDKVDLRRVNPGRYNRSGYYPNVRDVTRGIARRILESNVRLTKHVKDRLSEVMEHGHDGGSLSIELERATYRVTLYVGPSYSFGSYDVADRFPTDEAGNVFSHRSLEFQVNWQACGSQDAGDTLVYSELLREAATLCAELKAEFGKEEVWECCMTAAEKKAAEEKKLVATLNQAIRQAVRSEWKRMQVGQSKQARGEFGEAAVGHKFVESGDYDREYAGEVTGAGSISFTRVK